MKKNIFTAIILAGLLICIVFVAGCIGNTADKKPTTNATEKKLTKEEMIEKAVVLAKEFDNFSEEMEKNLRSAKDNEIIEYYKLLQIARKKGLKNFPGYY